MIMKNLFKPISTNTDIESQASIDRQALKEEKKRKKREAKRLSRKKRRQEIIECFGEDVFKKNKIKKRKSRIHATSDKFLESYEWRRLRMEVLKKYGASCQCCGANRKTGAVIHVDHIKPRKRFPELALDINNLQVLCHECNHGKGNWDMTDWR